MLTFDEFGHLIPDHLIASDLTEVNNVFAFNDKRLLIFSDLLAFLKNITDLGISNFQIWIDGSFVTRKESPKDADIVILIDFQAYEVNEDLFYLFKKMYSSTLDIYFVSVYPVEHPLFHRTRSDQAYWLTQFSKNRQGVRKGLILIDI